MLAQHEQGVRPDRARRPGHERVAAHPLARGVDHDVPLLGVLGVGQRQLDVLVVDLPPGTGDIPLSLAQAVALSGAVIVTQPPRLAATEALKAAEMFRSLDVPVLGVVENMTGPFGRGAGLTVSERLGVPFLGEIPFDDAVVDECDTGRPTTIARPESETAAAFSDVARGVATALGWAHV